MFQTVEQFSDNALAYIWNFLVFPLRPAQEGQLVYYFVKWKNAQCFVVGVTAQKIGSHGERRNGETTLASKIYNLWSPQLVAVKKYLIFFLGGGGGGGGVRLGRGRGVVFLGGLKITLRR